MDRKPVVPGAKASNSQKFGAQGDHYFQREDMGRLTEIICCSLIPQDEINEELLAHIDIEDRKTRDQIIELRAQQKRNQQLRLFSEE